MRKRVLGRVDSKAISPVIATVILVAITIVVALAFAFWSSGLVTAFQQTERLEVRIIHTGPQGGKVHVHIRNTGSSTVTITDVITLQGGEQKGSYGTAIDLTPGASARFSFNHGVNKGQSFEVAVITASGNTYYATATVPGG
jgi:flagellin-like protein